MARDEGPMPWRLSIAAQLMAADLAGCPNAHFDATLSASEMLRAADALIAAHKATEAQSDD